MTYDYCPCCQVETLPHADDCTFASDCPVECEQFNAVAELRGEVESLRLAIRRLAEQDATLSICDGAVTVTIDATLTLTDAEREAIERVAIHCADTSCVDTAKTLWGLLQKIDPT